MIYLTNSTSNPTLYIVIADYYNLILYFGPTRTRKADQTARQKLLGNKLMASGWLTDNLSIYVLLLL